MANTYGFDPVAWSVDGGRHRGELLRVLAYAATSGSEGIVSLDDCKVHELSTPGTQVAIDAGALLIRNRAANVRNQTYVANGRTETRLDVEPTTSAGKRSDLVIVRVEDPQYAGWTQPSQAAAPDFQYVKPFIIQNVPASTTDVRQLNLGYAAYALARLDIPASTSTITNSMVKNLRKVALPRKDRQVGIWSPADGSVPIVSPPVGPREWFPQLRGGLYCPEWASKVNLLVTISQLWATGNVAGHVRAEFGWNGGSNHLDTEDAGLHWDASMGTGRQSVQIAGAIMLPEAGWRDKPQFVQTGTVINAGSTGQFKTDMWTTVTWDAEFEEAAV